MGWGFYMIHGCLQVFASELSIEARATATVAALVFFFMGQTGRADCLRLSGFQHGGKAADPGDEPPRCMMVLGPRLRPPAQTAGTRPTRAV